MISLLHKHKLIYALWALIIIGGIIRLYDLNWGAPYYFHPDERNIAGSVSQLFVPTQMNPHFFAYGSLPIYAIYFVGLYGHFFQGLQNPMLSFQEAIVISRIFSALFSILLIPLSYRIGKEIRDTSAGIIAATFTTFSVGFIQFAHFGTFEMWLTFWTMLLFYTCILYSKEERARWVIGIGLIFGILCAIKVSSLALFPLIAATFFLKHRHRKFLINIKNLVTALLLSLIIYLVTNPFTVMDLTSFLGSMRYESGVATGSLRVFYTGEFVHIVPIFYPFVSVYPFLLNPLLTLLFVAAFVYLAYKACQTRNRLYLLLITSYLLLFLSQAFLYVQWTRYLIPTSQFAILAIAILLSDLLKTRYRKIIAFGTIICVSYAILYSLAFVITTYDEPDTRLQAVEFAKTNINPHQQIVSEVYDLGILPFNDTFHQISLFDFYALDEKSQNTPTIPTFNNAAYIILPSQRLLKVRTTHPAEYPNGYTFYTRLLNGSLGYKKIYETPCSIWCKIVYLNNPMYAFEGTASVFDRPIVTIFRKQ